jgi:hypothetical protein
VLRGSVGKIYWQAPPRRHAGIIAGHGMPLARSPNRPFSPILWLARHCKNQPREPSLTQNFRFGSITDISDDNADVRFTPESGHAIIPLTYVEWTLADRRRGSANGQERLFCGLSSGPLFRAPRGRWRATSTYDSGGSRGNRPPHARRRLFTRRNARGGAHRQRARLPLPRAPSKGGTGQISDSAFR